MRPPNVRFLTDTVAILDPGSAYDDERSPDESVVPPTAIAIACAVQQPKTSDVTRMQDGPGGDTALGVAGYEIPFAPPTGAALTAVLAIVAGSRLYWIANSAGTFAVPRKLAAEGPARPNGGRGGRWTISARWMS